ncbi:hypothetical protein C5167_003384 [Papaver somniferum]|uniref:Uncharacterized protein n=1 Tax=Papaver somniferum TaxID=3469 RepID=A0A4Y7L3Z9_PAPSO|nr:hypothetical protein C5167_003384 [Papaver somniferum]
MAARLKVTRSGRLNPDSESGHVIDVPFHGDVVKRAKWIARGLRRNIEEVLYLDCEEQRTLILRLLELHNPMRNDLYTDEVIDDWISLSQTPDISSSSSEDVPSIVGRSG